MKRNMNRWYLSGKYPTRDVRMVKIKPKRSPSPSPRLIIFSLWSSLVYLLALVSILASTFYFPSISDDQAIRHQSNEKRGLSSKENNAPIPEKRLKKISNIAWLLSFPNSGTTYTLANLEHTTNISTATNYENEVLSDIIYPLNHDEDAPFLFSPHLETASYVLTKTHCVGTSYCDDCHHSQTVQDAASFEVGCRRADINIRLPADESDTDHCRREDKYFYYSTNHINKVVHLIRNPFDNVVARMHLGVELRRQDPDRIWRGRNGDTEAFLRTFNDTKEGVLAWCAYVDSFFHDEASMYNNDGTFRGKPSEASLRNVTIPVDIMERLKDTPCHSEWFRYVQWHNLAIQMYTNSLRMVDDAHIIYYEEYTRDLERTTRKLTDFLEQPQVREPLRFIPGKVYRHLFSEQDRMAVARLIHALATPECWRHLRRYFADWFNENADLSRKKVETNINKAVSERAEVSNPRVIWLLSFPQSGWRWTMMHVNLTTDADMASHYWADSGPEQDLLWPNITHGPVLIKPRGSYVPNLVLTRNHVTGYCPQCPPLELYRNFQKMSNSVTRSINGTITDGDYPMELVAGSILLVRNPFDVIRTRAARGVIGMEMKETINITEEKVANMTDTRETLDRWCKIVDQHFFEHDEPPKAPGPEPTYSILYRSLIAARRWRSRRLNCPNLLFSVKKRYSQFGRELQGRITEENAIEYALDRKKIDIYRSIPCYSEWLRYVQFHNYALQYTRDFSGYVLYFEKFVAAPIKTLGELIHFLNLTKVHPFDKKRFNREKASHKQLYTPTEARHLATMVRTFASDETWGLLRHYFQDGDTFDNNLDAAAPLGM